MGSFTGKQGVGAQKRLRGIRAEEAKVAEVERNKLSPKEKVALLDKKLGKGVGAKKERKRLLKPVETPSEKKPKKEK